MCAVSGGKHRLPVSPSLFDPSGEAWAPNAAKGWIRALVGGPVTPVDEYHTMYLICQFYNLLNP